MQISETVNRTKGRPLEGLRVIDLTRALAGPYCSLLLAGMGAQVIKIEDPRSGDMARQNSPYVGRYGISLKKVHEDDVSVSHLTRSRGKLGVSLNLKHEQASAVFMDLVRDADIVLENFTPGTADRLGVGYHAVRAVNPRAIYCSLSGFGSQEAGGAKAMDVIIQALSGAMFTTGADGEPPVRLGIPIADMLAPLFGVIGILAALERRHTTNQGQHVDVSMLGALTSFVGIENWEAMRLAGLPSRTGLTVPRLSPFGIFKCADGFVAIVATQDVEASSLLEAIELAQLRDDSRFSSRDGRVANAVELEAKISTWTSTRSVEAVLATLATHGVTAAQVRDPEEALADPIVVERGETAIMAHPNYPEGAKLRTTGVPIRFSDADSGFDACLPVSIGQHNQEVYGGILGYSAERIAQLRDLGVL